MQPGAKERTCWFLHPPAHGHVNSALGLMEELARRGWRVVAWTPESFRERLEVAGARWAPLPDPGYDFGNPGTEHLRLAGGLLQASAAVLPRLLREAQEAAPALIVGDSFAPWGRFLSDLTGVPRVNFVSTLAFNRELADAMAPQGGAGPVVSDTQGAAAYSRHRAGLLKAFASLKGLTPLELFTNEAALNIVALPECLQPLRPTFDASFHFVGAMHPHSRKPQDLPLPAGFPRPLVYVSLGTVVNRDPEFFRRCAYEMAGIGGTLLMTTGGGVNARDLGCGGGNVHVLDHAPQFEVLAAADVFVSHGGVNGVRESLWHGVPMVTRPATTEHQLLARELEREGAALRLPQVGGDPGGIRRIVERVLADPAFRSHAGWLGEAMRRAGGPARAADLVEGHVASPQAPPGCA